MYAVHLRRKPTGRREMFGLAQRAITKPRAALLLFVALFAVAGVYGGSAPKVLKARNDFQDPGSQSAAAQKQIERASGAEPSPGVLVLVDGAPGAAGVGHVRQLLASDGSIARVGAPIPSTSGHSTLLAVTLRSSTTPASAVEGLEGRLKGLPGVKLGGGD